jgi:hypothetical protein
MQEMLNTEDYELTSVESEYEVVDYWRNHLPKGEFVIVPRLIRGVNPNLLLSLSEEQILCDCIRISREHLDGMTNKEVVEYINSQAQMVN